MLFKNKKILILLLLFLTCKETYAIKILGYELNAPWSIAYKQKKLQKEQENEKEQMVQTVDEWRQRATNIKMEHRVIEPYKKEVNSKLVEKLDIPLYFEKYNIAPGSREINLEKLKINKSVRSQGVISPDFRLMAYTEAYYFPSEQETLSSFFIYPLDTSKGKKQRIEDANVFAGAEKTPLMSSSHEYLKQFLFSVFTIVDWSKDSKKVLIKEKVGSSINGIYKTYIWVYFLQDNKTPYAYQKRFDRLNEIIKQYWFYKEKINLNHYIWDIKPLGFSAKNEKIIICSAHTYDEKNKGHDKKPIFLGLWSVNIETGAVELLSETGDIEIETSANGIILIQKLP